MEQSPVKRGHGSLNPLNTSRDWMTGVSPMVTKDSAVSPGPEFACPKSVPSQQNPQVTQISDSLATCALDESVTPLLSAKRSEQK
jgi:hypothetical protein